VELQEAKIDVHLPNNHAPDDEESRSEEKLGELDNLLNVDVASYVEKAAPILDEATRNIERGVDLVGKKLEWLEENCHEDFGTWQLNRELAALAEEGSREHAGVSATEQSFDTCGTAALEALRSEFENDESIDTIYSSALDGLRMELASARNCNGESVEAEEKRKDEEERKDQELTNNHSRKLPQSDSPLSPTAAEFVPATKTPSALSQTAAEFIPPIGLPPQLVPTQPPPFEFEHIDGLPSPFEPSYPADDFWHDHEDYFNCSYEPADEAASADAPIIAREAPNRKKKKKPPENTVRIVNQNAEGWRKPWKVEMTIETMIKHGIDAYLLQETWDNGDWEKEIRGYLVIHHNHEKEEGRKGRERRGVAIILSPKFKQAYVRAGRPKPITTDPKGEYSGRFIGISLHFPNIDSFGKKIAGNLKLFVASVYHPWEKDNYLPFLEELQGILAKAPAKEQRILGQDINANVGVGKEEEGLRNIIGPFGLDN
jgi:hypothetical protein